MVACPLQFFNGNYQLQLQFRSLLGNDRSAMRMMIHDDQLFASYIRSFSLVVTQQGRVQSHVDEYASLSLCKIAIVR
jgi:hypothetical protein